MTRKTVLAVVATLAALIVTTVVWSGAIAWFYAEHFRRYGAETYATAFALTSLVRRGAPAIGAFAAWMGVAVGTTERPPLLGFGCAPVLAFMALLLGFCVAASVSRLFGVPLIGSFNSTRQLLEWFDFVLWLVRAVVYAGALALLGRFVMKPLVTTVRDAAVLFFASLLAVTSALAPVDIAMMLTLDRMHPPAIERFGFDWK